MKKALVLLLSTFYILHSVSVAYAAEVGLSVTKNLFDISLVPGDTYEGTLIVFNQSAAKIPVKVQLSLWDIDSADELLFVDPTGNNDPTRWFDLGTSERFTLEPEGDHDLPFSINPPAATPAGSYFVIMRIIPDLPESAFEAAGPRFIPELGVLFFIGVAPLNLEGERSTYDGRISSFTPQGEGRLTLLERVTPGAAAGIYDELVRRFSVALENRGLHHFKAKGEVTLTNMLGFPVARFELPSRYLLPGHVRTFSAAASANDTWWERNGHLGRYTARLTLVVPEQELPQVSDISFWVFPWQLLLPLGAVAGAVVMFHARLLAAARAFVSGRKPNTRRTKPSVRR